MPRSKIYVMTVVLVAWATSGNAEIFVDVGTGVNWISLPNRNTLPVAVQSGTVISQPITLSSTDAVVGLDIEAGYAFGENTFLPVMGNDIVAKIGGHTWSFSDATSGTIIASDFGGSFVGVGLRPTRPNNRQLIGDAPTFTTSTTATYGDLRVGLSGQRCFFQPYVGFVYMDMSQDFFLDAINNTDPTDFYQITERLETSYVGAEFGGKTVIHINDSTIIRFAGSISPLHSVTNFDVLQVSRGSQVDDYLVRGEGRKATFQADAKVELARRTSANSMISIFGNYQYWHEVPFIGYPDNTGVAAFSATRDPIAEYGSMTNWTLGASVTFYH